MGCRPIRNVSLKVSQPNQTTDASKAAGIPFGVILRGMDIWKAVFASFTRDKISKSYSVLHCIRRLLQVHSFRLKKGKNI